MEIKTRFVEQEYYVSFDGKEFTDKEECERHESLERGDIKTCPECKGVKTITKNNDMDGAGNYGSRDGVSYWQEKCPKCSGRGYLEKKEVWK